MTISPFAMTTLATAKLHLGIPAGNTDFDDIVTRFINAATGKIETYCDRFFIERTITEYQDGIAQDRLLLDQWPAQKPTELWVDNTSEFTNTEKQLALDEYELELSAKGEGIGVILVGKKCGNLFRRGRRNIKIVYQAGYADVDALPDELEDACLWTMEFLYDMRNDRRIGTAVKGKNQENTTFRDDVPAFVQKTLDNYNRCEWPSGQRQVFTG